MDMVEKDISELTRQELLNPALIPSVYEQYDDEKDRKQAFDEIICVAKEKRALTAVRKAIAKCYEEHRLDKVDGNAYIFMNITGNKRDDTTIDNYVQAILNTPSIINNIKFNEFTGKFERIHSDGKTHCYYVRVEYRITL